MPILRARFFRTRGVYASVDAFRDAIEDGASDLLFPMVERAARRVTSSWRVDLEWDQYVSIDSRAIVHWIYPTGRGANVWKWVSQGVPGRLIVAKKSSTFLGKGKYKPALKLQRYKPFTRPGGYWGGPGIRYGAVGYRQAVYWTGIAPRNLEYSLAGLVLEDHIRISEQIATRAVRAAQRQGA
jgi:hypothetical protein